MPTDPDISVLIVSYNTRDYLLACLESLQRISDEAQFEIIVYDNASTDGSADHVQTQYPEVRLLQSDRNLGFAAGVNRAARDARGKYLFILNPDTLVPRNTIRRILRFFEAHPVAAVLGAGLYSPDGSVQPSVFRHPTLIREFWNLLPELKSLLQIHRIGQKFTYSGMRPVRVSSIGGAAFAVRADTFHRVGGLDEEYFLYHEEADFCRRLGALGCEIWTLPEAQVIHYNAAATGYRMRSLPRDPVLTWRILGMDRYWFKHESRFRYRLWSGQAKCLLSMRLLLLKAACLTAHGQRTSKIKERLQELKSLRRRIGMRYQGIDPRAGEKLDS